MRAHLVLASCSLSILFVGPVCETSDAQGNGPQFSSRIIVTPIVHSSVQLEHEGIVVQVDPWSLGDLSRAKPADLIVITDDPGHHLDVKAIAQLRKPGASVVIPANGLSSVPDGVVIANGETRTLAGVRVEAVPAYDVTPGEPYHPKGEANGYVLTLGGERIYVAGVTQCVREIQELRDIDVAFFPMNLPVDRMTPVAAAECVRTFRPKVVYLYHYDQAYAARLANPRSNTAPTSAEQLARDIQTFVQRLDGEPIEVRLGEWYPPLPIR